MQNNLMTRNLSIAQKIISLLLFIWGAFGVYQYSLRSIELLKYHDIAFLFSIYHPLLSVFAITFIAGIFLFFNKKVGWILSIASLAINGIMNFIPFNKYDDHVFASPELDMLILLAVIASFCLTGLIILLQKPFKERFNRQPQHGGSFSSLYPLLYLTRSISICARFSNAIEGGWVQACFAFSGESQKNYSLP